MQYSKEARISSDALTKHSAGLNIGLDVGPKQSEVVQEQSDASTQLSWKQKLGYYLRLSKIRLTGQWTIWLPEDKIQWVATKYFCANSEKTDLIGWLQTLTTSPPNHIRLLHVCAKKISKWKLGLKFRLHGRDKFETRLKFVLFCMFTQEPKNKMLDTETFLVSWFMWNHSLV